MAAYTGILIKEDPFTFLGENATGTISGIVTKTAVGVKRRVLLYQDPNTDLLAAGASDPADGSYSFPVSFAGITTKYTVVCKGDEAAGENDEILTRIVAVMD